MNKNASMSSLLVVALLALGTLAFIGLQDDATGAVQGIGGGQSIGIGHATTYNPIREDSAYYQQGGATAGDYAALRAMTEDLLHAFLLVNCKGTADPELKKICNEYSVSTA